MKYIDEENRNQMTLMPTCLDDYIEADNVVRVIDAFVETLDMEKLGFTNAKLNDRGRPPYNPAMLMKLYIYGYMNKVRSSRRLQTEAKRNVEVMWLTGKIVPDDRVIAYFRKNNTGAIKKVFKQFSIWCNETGLYGKEMIVVDGTKIRANASRKSIYTKKLTEMKLNEVSEKIEKYMETLNKTDEEEETKETGYSKDKVKAILKHLNEKKDELRKYKELIDTNKGKEISTIDPDARIMHTNGDGRTFDACYNVQSVADSKNKLIIDFEVTTCADDKGALPKMTAIVKEMTGEKTIEVTADKGYYDGEDIKECERNGVITYIPKTATQKNKIDPKYNLDNFVYNKETDTIKCPEKQTMELHREKKRINSETTQKIYQNKDACRTCKNKNKCFSNEKGYRQIIRSSYQEALDRNNKRMQTEEGKTRYKMRNTTIEHPFGVIKSVWGYRQYLCRGKIMATAEQSLAFLAYNIRRVANIYKKKGINLVNEII